MNRQASRDGNLLAMLGQRVRHLRALRGMSRKALSAAAGISERYIAQLESGKGNISVLLLNRISAAIGAGLDELFCDDVEDCRQLVVFRELLKTASPEQIGRARSILAGDTALAANPHAQRDRRIALIGARGAGKSTLGQLAAERLQLPFIELNREIERQNSLPVPEIFAIYGQEGFRRFEQACLSRIVKQPGPFILATGGGIVAAPMTFELLLSTCWTVWIKASPEEHMTRVHGQGEARPPGDDGTAAQELEMILTSREPLYARAHAVAGTSGIQVGQAVDRLIAAIAVWLTREPLVE